MEKYVNKVEYNGKPLIDLTQDTVTPQTLKAGETAHSKTGEKIIGEAKMGEVNSVNGKTGDVIIESLPANGGNSDTVGGYSIVVSNSPPTVNNNKIITIVV